MGVVEMKEFRHEAFALKKISMLSATAPTFFSFKTFLIPLSRTSISRSSQTKWLREIHEEYQKSKSGMIDDLNNDLPNNDVQNNLGAVNNELLADKCSVIKTQHTKNR